MMNLENVKILYTQNLALAQNVNADVTIEAEYGDTCVEGKILTLAHHGSRSNNPAPCELENQELEFNSILVSHLDLDTLGGIMAVLNIKKGNSSFWKDAAYIDVNGTHHMHKLPKVSKELINAYYYISDQLGRLPLARDEVKDITETVEEFISKLNKLFTDEEYQKEMIEKGREWAENKAKQVENCLVKETPTIRCFITDGVFCGSSYYSPQLNSVCEATISMNTKFNSITLAFEDGGKEYNAVEIVQELWGTEAGGRAGIAGSPRGWNKSSEELEIEFNKLISKVEEIMN